MKFSHRHIDCADIETRLFEKTPVDDGSNEVVQPIRTDGTGEENGDGGNDGDGQTSYAFFAHDRTPGKILGTGPSVNVVGSVGAKTAFGSQSQPSGFHVIPGHPVTIVTQYHNLCAAKIIDLYPFRIGVMGVFEKFVDGGGNAGDLLPTKHVNRTGSHPQFNHLISYESYTYVHELTVER
ncbi:MAG: hypothetical protein WCW53_04365 [Syntrophales bacterium]